MTIVTTTTVYTKMSNMKNGYCTCVSVAVVFMFYGGHTDPALSHAAGFGYDNYLRSDSHTGQEKQCDMSLSLH